METSAFSSEFIALRFCVVTIQGLRYKLRMFGIPIDGDGGPAHVFCDNEAVVNNTTKVESKLNKKHCAIAYHYIRWAVAAGVVTIAWISTKENLADALTKKLSRVTRSYLFGNWTYGCYAD